MKIVESRFSQTEEMQHFIVIILLFNVVFAQQAPPPYINLWQKMLLKNNSTTHISIFHCYTFPGKYKQILFNFFSHLLIQYYSVSSLKHS